MRTHYLIALGSAPPDVVDGLATLAVVSGDVVDAAVSGEGVIWLLPSWILIACLGVVLLLGVLLALHILRVQQGRALAAREAAARWRPDPTPAGWEPVQVRVEDCGRVIGLLPGESVTLPAIESQRAVAEIAGPRRPQLEPVTNPAQLGSGAQLALPAAEKDRDR